MPIIRTTLMIGLLISALGCSLAIQPGPEPFYRAVLEKSPGNELALFAQAEAFGRQGQFKQARRYYRRCLRQNPQSAPAWLGLGRSDMELFLFAEAEKAFRTAMELRPSEEAQSALTTALLLQGKSILARQENQAMLKRYGDSAARLRLDGDIEFYENHPKKSLDAYTKSLAIYPQQPKIEQRVRELEDYLTSTP